MSLNGRLALVALLALPFSPILLLLSPIVIWRRIRSLRIARLKGYRQLDMTMVACLSSCADAMIRGSHESADGCLSATEQDRVVREIDRFLDLGWSARTWRTKALILALEHAPRARFLPPFSRLSVAERRDFVDRHLSTTRGLFGVLSLSRQLVRIGYYCGENVQRALGFVPYAERGQLRSRPAKPVIPV